MTTTLTKENSVAGFEYALINVAPDSENIPELIAWLYEEPFSTWSRDLDRMVAQKDHINDSRMRSPEFSAALLKGTTVKVVRREISNWEFVQ